MTLGKTPWVDQHVADILPKLRQQVPASWLPRMGASLVVEEYGCGHFGCVMPTYEPGLVIKLTTDVQEAWFVARMMKLAKQPGIVAYKKIFVSATPLDPGPGPWGGKYSVHPTLSSEHQVTTILGWANAVSKTSGDARAPKITMSEKPSVRELSDWLAWADPTFYQDEETFYRNILLDHILVLARVDLMFVLWRTEARDVGSWVHELVDRVGKRRVNHATGILLDYTLQCEAVYRFLGGELLKTPSVVERRKLLTTAWDAYEQDDPDDDIAVALQRCLEHVQEMQDDPLLSDVGQTLAYYMKHGLLVGDLHGGNFGLSSDPADGDKLIITDPGLVVEFHPRWAQPPQIVIL
jgi:hypothetical protein